MRFKLEEVIEIETKNNISKDEFNELFKNWVKENGWEYYTNSKLNSRFLPHSQSGLELQTSTVFGGALFGTGTCENDHRRYYLSKVWNTDLPTAAAFLMNPSNATELSGDNTIDFLIEYLNKRNYGGLIVVNTSSVIKASKVTKKHFPLEDKNNELTIINVIREADVIILGWGEKGNNFAVRNFSNSIKELLIHRKEVIRVFDIGGKRTSTGRQLYPCHPSPVGNKSKYEDMELKSISEYPDVSIHDLLR